jgi:hypothetical protein
MKFVFYVIIMTNSLIGNSQTEGWLAFPVNNDTTNIKKDTVITDSIVKLNFNQTKPGSLKVMKPDELDKVTEFVAREKETIEGVKIEGYRIQIFFDESKTSAQSQKANFINTYPNHKAYIDYMAPNYRVRVGNFRTQLEAEKLKQELIAIYPTCIVIKDKIELPKIEVESNE